MLAAAAVRFLGAHLASVPEWAVPVLVAAVAIAAAFAPARPTGWAPLDVLMRAALAAAVVGAAATTHPRWTVLLAGVLSATVVLAGAPGGYLAMAATGVLVALLASGIAGADARPVVALCAGLAVQDLLRLDWPHPTGASAVVATACVLPLLVAGARRLPRAGKVALGWSIAGAVAVALFGAAVSAAAALQARTPVERAVVSARSGLTTLTGGNAQGAASAFRSAAGGFRQGERAMTRWWVKPALAVPFVAQQTRAISTLASAGGDLSDVAARSLVQVDTNAIRAAAGQVNLAAVRELAQPLGDVASSLRSADRRLHDVDSPWLLAPVADRYALLSQKVAGARHDADTAASAAKAAPTLLGADGPRHYFLAVQTPSESRGSGGFMGNWGELTATNGRVELSRFGRVAELVQGGIAPSARVVKGHDDLVARYGSDVLRVWGILNLPTDFPTVADVMTQLYPQSGGEKVDGVIGLDPYAFAALLKLTGPVTVAGLKEPLTSENAARVLLYDQYVTFAENQRADFLGDATKALFGRLTSGDIGNPPAVSAALSPAVQGRHLQLYSARPDEQRFFDLIGASGRVQPVGGESVGIVGQNHDGNKIDWFLHRDASYSLTWDPGTGKIRGVYEIKLRNDAPATGLPHSVIGWGGDVSRGQTPVNDGENLMELSVYSVTAPTKVTLDGQLLPGRFQREYGRFVYTSTVNVGPKSTRVVRVETEGRLKTGRTLHVDPLFQPMVNADTLSLNVQVAKGWTLRPTVGVLAGGGSSASVSWTLDRSRRAVLKADRSHLGIVQRLRQASG